MRNHNRSADSAKPDVSKVDFEALPAKQSLIVDILTARHRLGEPFWPIEVTLDKTLDALLRLGVVEVWTYTSEHHRVMLTDAAKKRLIDGVKYTSPLERELAEARADVAALKRSLKLLRHTDTAG
ncbi:hypothetical protein [Curtobacterium sp. MCBD17_040]|uniref:hypothetical protein n=1 Tax=Curtobacterium sp. MCBD17_040 TaxID=2175674 RepID=UPI000DA976E8|nr:hypothetical protein [Curtobacterium sp. MCBD17_040]WIB65287.1 hypothetical protein DEI94_17940 [Curtobacterium sp. MCBD17_040]